MGSLHGSLVKISVKLLEDTGEPGDTHIPAVVPWYRSGAEYSSCTEFTTSAESAPLTSAIRSNGRCQIKGLRRTGQQSVIRNAHECPAPCSDLR